ncbi:MAG TPA: hypothetical protein VGK81_05600 [Anaerolineae bacterium]|jgi:hypothetical protein
MNAAGYGWFYPRCSAFIRMLENNGLLHPFGGLLRLEIVYAL